MNKTYAFRFDRPDLSRARDHTQSWLDETCPPDIGATFWCGITSSDDHEVFADEDELGAAARELLAETPTYEAALEYCWEVAIWEAFVDIRRGLLTHPSPESPPWAVEANIETESLGDVETAVYEHFQDRLMGTEPVARKQAFVESLWSVFSSDVAWLSAEDALDFSRRRSADILTGPIATEASLIHNLLRDHRYAGGDPPFTTKGDHRDWRLFNLPSGGPGDGETLVFVQLSF